MWITTCLLLAVSASLCVASMDITAFEYQRKFGQSLALGQCPQREVAKKYNGTVLFELERCTMQMRGKVSHLPRELSDTRNVLITSPSGIVAYLGLCGGEAASYLGILYSGDCVAVEIASKLTFSDKFVVRAFVGYYRKSLDILEVGTQNIRVGMDQYLKDKYYLKTISYGTLEIIFVQLRYRTAKQAKMARNVTIESPVMSDYMKAIKEKAGHPKGTTVISLSTATQQTFNSKRYESWDRAFRDVRILEMQIGHTRETIAKGIINPALKYQLTPFIGQKAGRGGRLPDPITWEKTSMLEVELRQSIWVAKKTSRKCRKNRTTLCRRVRQLRRLMVKDQSEIHNQRSNWMELSPEEKNNFASRFSSRIKNYTSVTKTLAKNVRSMRKKDKVARLTRKRKRPNQINQPLFSRVRHMGRKAGRRRNRFRL